MAKATPVSALPVEFLQFTGTVEEVDAVLEFCGEGARIRYSSSISTEQLIDKRNPVLRNVVLNVQLKEYPLGWDEYIVKDVFGQITVLGRWEFERTYLPEVEND